MTDKEKKAFVDKHITEIFPQLQINMGKVCGSAYDKWGDDLLSISLEYFLNKPLDVQYDSCVNNKCENFVTFIANFQLKSSSSKFYHTHRKTLNSYRELYDNKDYTDHLDPETDDMMYADDFMLCIKENINKLDPYEKMLVEERVIKGYRYKEISERYDIPYASLAHNLKKVLKKLKQQCSHLQQFR